MSDGRWTPEIGEMVWFNYPDNPEPMGKVVGFVPADVEARAGQPVIEVQEDERGRFATKKKGDRFVMHPRFLLPFALGGEEWQKADADGRVR